jgi:integrase
VKTTDGRQGSVKPNPEKPGTYMFVVDLAEPGEPRQQKRGRGFPTKKAAQAALDKLKGEVRSQTYVDRDKVTLRVFAEQTWLPHVKGQVRASTFESYDRVIRLHVLRDLGEVEVQRLTPKRWKDQLDGLAAGGRADYAEGRALSRRTVQYVHTLAKAMLDYAVEQGLRADNPAAKVKPPKAEAEAQAHARIQTWPREVLGAFLNRAREEQHRHHVAWQLLATTGMRRGEVLGLAWLDVDFDASRLRVRRTLVDMHGDEPVWSDPKTASGKRSIALDAGTVAALRKHRAQQLEMRLAVGAGYVEHDLVFALPDGRPLHPERFSRTFTETIRRWKLPQVRLHDLRHTWATLALEAGVHPKVVQERLGHANVSITLGIYTHVSQSMESDAAERVAGLFLDGEQ